MGKLLEFESLPALAQHLRDELEEMKYILLYAYNGTGKTRLSTTFKEVGKQQKMPGKILKEDGGALLTEDGDTILLEEIQGDTLYFNAFTEDLFAWDNDLDNDELRVLELNAQSTFFDGLGEFEIETRVRRILDRYADFEFSLDLVYEVPATSDEKPRLHEGKVTFTREVVEGEGELARRVRKENIKISRGEERIFVWCFFLAIIEIKLDPDTDAYDWVNYIYIDDPISSLDEENTILVATHLAKVLKDADDPPGIVISTHHPLFHNVLWNELKKKSRRYFLGSDRAAETYAVRNTQDTPFFHHIASLIDLYEVDKEGELNTYHFNTLRAIAEKTASFLGYDNFGDCIKRETDDLDGRLHTRLLNLLSHGGYSIYEPKEMLDDNKHRFHDMLHKFVKQYAFNPRHFPELDAATSETSDD